MIRSPLLPHNSIRHHAAILAHLFTFCLCLFGAKVSINEWMKMVSLFIVCCLHLLRVLEFQTFQHITWHLAFNEIATFHCSLFTLTYKLHEIRFHGRTRKSTSDDEYPWYVPKWPVANNCSKFYENLTKCCPSLQSTDDPD